MNQPVKVDEKARTYYFPNGKVELVDVIEIVVRDSGTHRLKTKDGSLHIVPIGWLHVEIKADEWTF